MASGQDTRVLARFRILSLDPRTTSDLKMCFLLAFTLHRIYICFHYNVRSSKNGMFKIYYLPLLDLFSLDM